MYPNLVVGIFEWPYEVRTEISLERQRDELEAQLVELEDRYAASQTEYENAIELMETNERELKNTTMLMYLFLTITIFLAVATIYLARR